MTNTDWTQSLLTLPRGTVLSITMKGTGRVIVGTFAGEYTRDIRPSILVDTADGSNFPVIAVALGTIADAQVIGGTYSDGAQVPIGGYLRLSNINGALDESDTL